MFNRFRIFLLAVLPFAGCALHMAVCRTVPGFGSLWLRLFILPAARLQELVSARFSFPMLETGAAVLGISLLLGIIRLIRRCIRKRKLSPLSALPAMLYRPAVLLFSVYALMWYPACWSAPPARYDLTAGQLETLCRTLISRLNETELTFSRSDALDDARRAASAYAGTELPENAVKYARYPEWMNVLGLSGLYSPWTAEALVHPSLSPASLPFTACHELMHRLGIADEGQANIAAWEACRQAGGQASASADLWALKYAMNALRAYSEEIWRDCTTEMDGALVRAFSDMNGFATPSPQRSPLRARIISALGLDSVTGNYDALIGRLAIDIPPTG